MGETMMQEIYLLIGVMIACAILLAIFLAFMMSREGPLTSDDISSILSIVGVTLLGNSLIVLTVYLVKSSHG